ncbi:MAG: sensor histidine kinase [Acidimicrobiales bacterium]
MNGLRSPTTAPPSDRALPPHLVDMTPGPAPNSPSRRKNPAVLSVSGPWTSSWFWLLQLVILAVSLVRVAVVVHLGLSATAPAVEYSTMLIFLPLTALGALAFGLQGALVSCGWTLVLSIPLLTQAIGQHRPSVAVAEVLQLTVLMAVGLATGWVVGAERRTRRAVQRSLLASAHAKAVYRDLFDSNTSPILVVDGTGSVIDANATAVRAFDIPAAFGQAGAHPAAEQASLRLIDVVGAEAAGLILGGLLSSVSHGISRRRVDASAEEATPTDTGPMPPVEIPFNEHPTLFRPSITVLADIWDERRMQVVFQDVTEERRQRELVETFAAHVILGQEEERQRISQELHDGPLQNLIHLCRQIDAVDQSNGAMSSTDDIRKSTEDLVQEIRSISRGLRPSALDDLGLVASIGQLLTDAERRHHIATSFGVTGQERRLPSDVELALFRIAQEALSNIERHAAARTVAVGLDYEGGGLRLLVKDDGIGFAPDTTRRASANQSLGIPGMAERASLIGARLVVHSRPGSGTSIDVRVPAAVIIQ